MRLSGEKKLPKRLAKAKKNYWKLGLIIFLAAVLRFGGLNWGAFYPFHPDEWNMAAAIGRLGPENRFHPGFFAYGQLPLYLSYFSARAYNLLPWQGINGVSPKEGIFFLRFWSALAGLGTVWLVFLVTQNLIQNKKFALLASALAAFTPGLIQISHFGTTESWLSFCFLGVVYFSLKILDQPKFKNFFFASIFFGLALGAKISALIFAFPLLLATGFLFFKTRKAPKVWFCFPAFFLAIGLALLTSPYLIFDFNESRRILTYEMQIATGQIPVFYTRQFFNTLPVVFQLRKIFPYTLGWPIFILGALGIAISMILLAKNLFTKQKIIPTYSPLILILGSFFIYFFSQAFLFCKWTRFMAPAFAFFAVFAGIFFEKLFTHLRKGKLFLGYLIFFLALLPGLIFSSIYFQPDIRFTASEWIYENLPREAKVLSESGNVIDLPVFPPNHQSAADNYLLSVTSFDFYHLDDNPLLFPQLLTSLEEAEYLFLPSRRLFANHLRLKEKYPLTAKYYQLLFSGQLGFQLVKEISPFPFGFSDEKAEETWSVFDHPVIRIYQKKDYLKTKDYEKLFQQN